MAVNTKCLKDGEIMSELDNDCHYVGTRGPCGKDQWIVLDGTRGICQDKKCKDDMFMYKGKCQNLFEREVCPIGERLYLTLEGFGKCGCKDGWFRKNPWSNCIQEFTQGDCENGKILKIKNDIKTQDLKVLKSSGSFFFPSKLEELKKKKKLVCIENPCSFGTLPHTDTWEDSKTCHKVTKKVVEKENCELEVWSKDNTLFCGLGPSDIVPFALAPVFQGRKCRVGRVWSKYRKRCVRTYG